MIDKILHLLTAGGAGAFAAVVVTILLSLVLMGVWLGVAVLGVGVLLALAFCKEWFATKEYYIPVFTVYTIVGIVLSIIISNQ